MHNWYIVCHYRCTFGIHTLLVVRFVRLSIGVVIGATSRFGPKKYYQTNKMCHKIRKSHILTNLFVERVCLRALRVLIVHWSQYA